MADLDFGMDKAHLKQLLGKSKAEPVSCAMGKGKDASAAYLRLDKIKPGRKLEGELSKDFPDMKDGRWGTAFVDTDVNPKLVLFRINKPSSGMAKRLIKVVKQVGYSKVRFEFEDGSAPEDLSEEEEGGEAAAPQAAAPAPAPEPASLKPRLTAAVQRIPQILASAPGRKDELLGFAKQGQTLLAGTDYQAALAGVEKLEIALEAPVVAAAAAPSANTGAVAYGKSRLAWLAVRKQMEGDIEKLRAALLDTYKGTPVISDITAKYNNRVGPMLTNLDESLADALDEATNATDPQKRAELVTKARDTIKRYQDYMQSETLFGELDGNPFVPLNTTAILTKTLATLSASVH